MTQITGLAAACALITLLNYTALATDAQKSVGADPIWWARHLAIVRIPIAGKEHSAVLDTGGYTQLRSLTPRDFGTYYRRLPIDAVWGANSIQKRVINVGPRQPGPVQVVPVHLQRFKHEVYAFASVHIGVDRLTMLFDTCALGWASKVAMHARPIGISFLRSKEFLRLHHLYPRWPLKSDSIAIVNQKGTLVNAATLAVPQIRIGAFMSGPVLFVERSDDTTYETLWNMGHINVSGDLGLAPLNPKWLELDYPHSKIAFGSSS